jgi:multiple sugar transport system permease protein
MFWCILGTVISCSLVAYGFARLRFPGRDFLFGVMIASMMIPGAVLMIPNFVLFKMLGWYNTILPLTVPAFFGAPFFIFLLRQYMLTLPLELDDAARIDGANRFQVFSQIVMPLCFMGVWGDLMGPLIYLNDTDKYTVAVGLAMFQNISIYGGTDWGAMMAGSVMSVLPCIVIYYFAQDKLIGGIASVGLKG